MWLDSTSGGQFSILAAKHTDRAVFTKNSSPKDFLRFLDRVDGRKEESPADLPFACGWVGYMAYEAYRFNDLIPLTPSHSPEYPLAAFYFFETFFLLDHSCHALFFVCRHAHGAHDLTTFMKNFSVWKKEIQPSRSDAASARRQLPTRVSQARYHRDLFQIQESLLRGDYFELNYTLNQRLPWGGDPFTLFLALRDLSPAPMMAYLKFPQLHILSASPETFFAVNGRRVVTEPIKGTRGRGKNKIADEKIKRKLIQSPKDRAELLMVTDLLRSDLGRICKPGTIRPSHLFHLKSFSHYHHLVSRIEGELEDHITAPDIFRALFPGGSITGAPKIKVMEHIDQLEGRPRGVYTGAVGYLSCNGNMQFNIPIRTLTLSNNILEFATGGGIVADSRIDDEYQECQIKAAGILQALEQC